MKQLTSILAMNHSGVIGSHNSLPWRLRTDLAFFKAQTRNSAIIMGRKTFDSLGRRPLPERYNVVLSHTPQLALERPDLRFAYGIPEGLHVADKFQSAMTDCFIVGGATMYEQFSPFVERYLITLVDKEIIEADTRISLDMFGDPDAWEVIHHQAYPAAPPGDEVPFSIIELRSRHTAAIRQKRRKAIEAFRSEAMRNSRSSKWAARKAAQEASVSV